MHENINQFRKRYGAKTLSYEFIINPNEESWLAFCASMFDIRQEWDKPLKGKATVAGKRSLAMNNTYWMWLGELSHQIKQKSGEGYSTDDLHEYMKARFCPDKDLRFGKKLIQVKSTAKLDKGEMHFYMNQVHEWAVNAGFKLTMPIESEYRQIMEQQNA